MLYPLSYEGGTCGIPCGKPAGPCRDLVGSRRIKSRGPDSALGSAPVAVSGSDFVALSRLVGVVEPVGGSV